MTFLVPTNRNLSGLLIIQDVSTGRVLGRFEALGRGSRGGGDTQFLEKGNTPTGEYSVLKVENTTGWSHSSYGVNGALRLKPKSGNALDAEKKAGRKGLLIHGGSLGGFRGLDELKPTHGCIRMRNEDIATLINLLFEATLNESKMQSEIISVSLAVMECNMSFERPK